MKKKSRSLRCPSCRSLVLREDPHFPFCSERCRTIDLGKWASGGYVISTPITDPEELMDAEAAQRQQQSQTGAASNPDAATAPHDKSRR